ncbi:MFS transporter [Pseudogracilibacillus sp. SO30301A]|uniref:MFS transporter n=1 Tax=Pseudogracilibacillus sp. SO30301A TaxID=3098291 RepID=UPI00300DC5D6
MINKNFSLLFIASVISTLGASMTYISLYWNYFEQTTVVSLTLLTTVTFLSGFIFSLFLSPFCDKYKPKNMMIFTMVMRTIILIIFGIGMLFLDIHIYFMIFMMVLLVALESLYDPSSVKIITNIVKKEEYTTANSWITILDRIGVLFGMLLGGIVIISLNLGTILLIEAGAFLIGVIILLQLKEKSAADDNKKEIERENYYLMWKEGIAYIIKTKWLIGVLLVAIAANLAITPSVTLLIPYTSEVLQGDSIHYSIIQISSILGSILMAYIISKIKLKLLVQSFLVAAILQSCIIMLLSMNSNILITIILIFLLGCFVALFNVPFVTLLQRHVPNYLLGRVRGGMIALSTGLSSLGYALSGIFTVQMGIRLTIFIYGLVGFIIIFSLVLFKPFSSISITNNQEKTVETDDKLFVQDKS